MKFLSIIVAGFTVFANAALAEAINYQQVLSLASKGTLPTRGEVSGWWSGRCYAQAKPTESLGAVMVAEVVNHTLNNYRSFNIIILSPDNGVAPDRYDHLSDADQAEVQMILKGDVFQNLLPHIDGNALSSSAVISEHNDVVKYQVTKAASGLFEAEVKLVGSNSSSTVLVCEFSKKVHD